jgi:hypothetical protein
MNDAGARVEHLKEVVTSVTAGTAPGSADLLSSPTVFRFIYGLGPAGLTPFEYELADRRVGETVVIRAGTDGLNPIFGHLLPPLPRFLEDAGEFYLGVHIDDVKPSDPKAVVRALAEIADCGDHCCGH